jgi:sugar lactone lactonase YvrE
MSESLPLMLNRRGLTLLGMLMASSAWAVRTESTVHEGFASLDKGTFEQVGLTDDGKLFPTRQLVEVASLPAAIVWEAIADEQGSLILSTGNNGTVYRLGSDGQPTVLFQPEESLSRAMLRDSSGRLYVGTSPKGRVYRLLPDGTQEIFFDPPELYIWDMKLGADGCLYVATGGKGKIYRVPLDFRMGDSAEVLFEASEMHVNHLAFAPAGDLLYAGCGSGGNLYAIRMDGTYQALFHSGAEEVKAIFPQDDASVYFATFSAGQTAKPVKPANKEDGKPATSGAEDAANSFMMTIFASDLPERNGLMHLDADGNLKTIWSLSPNRIFSVLPQKNGPWLIGTGTNGRVFASKGGNAWSNVFSVPSGGEVTRFIPIGDSGDAWVISSNPAKVYRLGSSISDRAIYTSEVIDTGKMVDWGNLRYLSVTGSFDNHVEIETRSGNLSDPNRSWSEWQKLDADGGISSPNSRFLQYRIHLLPENPGIQRIQVFFQEQNLAPEITQIRMLQGAYSLFSPQRQPQPFSFSKVFGGGEMEVSQRVPQMVKEKEEGAITAVWLPEDPNRDRLLFDLMVRKVGAENWIRVATDLSDPLMPMDIRGLEEGYYQVQVVADDRLDNHPDRSLRFEKVSDPFLIDFTSPGVSLEEPVQEPEVTSIRFTVRDAFGVIERVYYTLNGGHVRKALPKDGLFDSRLEHFELRFDKLEPGSYSLIVQGYDENGNIGVATCAFTVAP